MALKVDKRNKPILNFPETHPAHRLLKTFVECRDRCVGREITWPEVSRKGIDQAWYSESDKRRRTFSGFAYEFLAFDLILEEWISNPPYITEQEKLWVRKLAHMEILLDECKHACEKASNAEILGLVQDVQALVDVWRVAIKERQQLFLNDQSDGK